MAVAVIDIGKTNAKVALVDIVRGTEIETRRVANAIVGSGLYPHYDVERLWTFILESLAALAKIAPVEAISTTTHGATAALLDYALGLAHWQALGVLGAGIVAWSATAWFDKDGQFLHDRLTGTRLVQLTKPEKNKKAA